MFRWRRSSTPSATRLSWSELRAALQDSAEQAAVLEGFPQPRPLSFLDVLRRIEPQLATDIVAAGQRLEHAAELVDWPVVAVAGMLNSGKTSLVASLLGPSGRRRALIGVGNAQGTHRFVLWLPQRWRQDETLWTLLLQRLGDALGAQPEPLAEQPEAAHRQYNNREQDAESLMIPLVATDPALDTLGIGLLDCPDIVSDPLLGLGTPARRRELLGRAATLCSAFLVVASAEQSRDMTLGDLLRVASELMPGIPRLLAVNKVRAAQQSPAEVHQTFQPVSERHRVESVYIAYDFDIPGNQPLIPAQWQSSLVSAPAEAQPLPVFFEIFSKQAKGRPQPAATPESLLAALPGRLDRGQLFERFRKALEENLKAAVWDRGRARIAAEVDSTARRVAAARGCLTEVALDVFAVRGERAQIERLRLHQNERIVAQLSATFAATAPWYARASVAINGRYRRIVGSAGDWFRRWLPTQVLDDSSQAIRGRLRRGEYGSLMTPQQLHSLIHEHGAAFRLEHWPTEAPWEDACRTAIRRYDRDDFTTLDPVALQQACGEMWQHVAWHQKWKMAAVPLVVMLTSFSAVLMLPVDMGASVLAAASISELLAAGGLTAAASIWAGGKTASLVEQQAAKQQFVDFVAVLCDTFGVPRPETMPALGIDGQEGPLPEAKIAHREPAGPVLSSLQWHPDFEARLAQALGLDPAAARANQSPAK